MSLMCEPTLQGINSILPPDPIAILTKRGVGSVCDSGFLLNKVSNETLLFCWLYLLHLQSQLLGCYLSAKTQCCSVDSTLFTPTTILQLVMTLTVPCEMIQQMIFVNIIWIIYQFISYTILMIFKFEEEKVVNFTRFFLLWSNLKCYSHILYGR